MNTSKEGKKDADSKLAHFIKYNNAVPIVLGLLCFSTTATFAATPAARDAIYTSSTEVQSVDNSYIRSVNLERYDFSIRITKITEDTEYIYLDYDFDTIDVVDSIWRDTTKQNTLRISKALLRNGDLEAYAESELSQVGWSERQRLVEVQKYEQKLQLSQKTVATVYKGIVGNLIEPSAEVFPAYQPPPQEQGANDPLKVKNPKPLVTWDANAKVKPEKPVVTPNPTPTPSDPGTGGGEDPVDPPVEDPGTTTPPIEEETPPSPEEETPPVEEPPVEPETPEEPVSESETPVP